MVDRSTYIHQNRHITTDFVDCHDQVLAHFYKNTTAVTVHAIRKQLLHESYLVFLLFQENNRFNVPINTKFLRVRCAPYPPLDPPHSPRVDGSQGAASGSPKTASERSPGKTPSENSPPDSTSAPPPDGTSAPPPDGTSAPPDSTNAPPPDNASASDSSSIAKDMTMSVVTDLEASVVFGITD